MDSTSSIIDLASIIGDSVTKLDEYFKTANIPLPSFDVHSIAGFPPLPGEILSSRMAGLAATNKLYSLLLGPTEHLFNSSEDPYNSISLQFICRHKIAEFFQPGEETTFEEIATGRGLDLSDTQRILRHAMTYYVFEEPRKGIVSHTSASRVLVDNPMATAWVSTCIEYIWPACGRVLDASEKWPGSEEPAQSAFSLAHNTDLTPFDFIEGNPALANRFKNAMNFFHSSPGFEPIHFINSFDFASLGNGVFVDIGGSHGAVGIEIARKHSQMKCIIQDLPTSVSNSQVPEDLSDQVQFMAHDMFQDQPVKGADVYYFRWIFHDWSDAYAVKILKCLIPALKPDAKIIINEVCLPDHGQAPLYMQRRLRCMDMNMRAFSNAKERDATDWIFLFQTADERFKIEKIERPPASKLHVIIATWKP